VFKLYVCLFLEKVKVVLISYKNEQFRVSAVLTISTFGSSCFLLGAVSLLFILTQSEDLVLLARPHLKYLIASMTKLLCQEFISCNCRDPIFSPCSILPQLESVQKHQ